jgi:hypothetical protein
MPTFVAMLIASLAGWLVEGPVRAALGPLASMVVSFLLAAVVFFPAKRFVSDLRGSS